MDFLAGIAQNISKDFVGAESAAIFIMIIFYLVVFILILGLLMFAGNCTKRLFKTFAHPKKTKRPNAVEKGSPAGTAPASADTVNCGPETPPSEVANIPSEPTSTSWQSVSVFSSYPALDAFDGQAFLDRIKTDYKLIDEAAIALDEFQFLPAVSVNPISPVSLDEDTSMPETEMRSLIDSLQSKQLNDLYQLVAEEEHKQSNFVTQLDAMNQRFEDNTQSHEKLIDEEASAVKEYNTAVTSLRTLEGSLGNVKEELAVDHATVLKAIAKLAAQKTALLEDLKQAEEAARNVPDMVECFHASCLEKTAHISDALHQKSEVLSALKTCCSTIQASRINLESKISTTQEKIVILNKQKLVSSTTISLIRSRIAELEKIEAERKTAEEEAARLAAEEAERQKREEAARHEAAEARIHEVAASSYALNFDNISPETIEQLAKMRKMHDKPKTPISKENLPSLTNDNPAEDAPAVAQTVDISIPISDSECNNASSEASSPAPEQPVDYFKELKQEWAAEKAHREAFQAEMRQKEAETAQRRKDLEQSLSASESSTEN